MKKCILLIPLVLALHCSYGQTNSRPLTGLDAENNLNALVNQSSAMVRVMDSRYEGVKGTPFFLDQFGFATFQMTDNKVYENVSANYNVHDNEVHYRDSKNVERVLPKTQLRSFILKDSVGVQYYKFKLLSNVVGIDEKHKVRFALIPYEGAKTTFAVIHEKDLLKADFKGGYSSGRTYDELINQKTYYLIKQNNNAVKTKLSKKALLEALPDKRNELELFVKNEKVDLTKEVGWVQALTYYETLK